MPPLKNTSESRQHFAKLHRIENRTLEQDTQLDNTNFYQCHKYFPSTVQVVVKRHCQPQGHHRRCGVKTASDNAAVGFFSTPFFYRKLCVCISNCRKWQLTQRHTPCKKRARLKKVRTISTSFFFACSPAPFSLLCLHWSSACGQKRVLQAWKKTTIVKRATWATLQLQKAKKKNTKSMLFLYIHISLAFIQNYCRHYKPRSTSWPSTLASLTTSSNKSQKCELKCHATTALAEGQNIHRLETSCTLIERLGRGVKAKNAQVTWQSTTQVP